MNIGLCIDSTNQFKGVYQYTKHLIDKINYQLIDKPHNNPIISTILNCFKRFNYDIIHIPDFKIYHLPIILLSKSKIVITLHGGRLWIPTKSIPTFKDKPQAWLFYRLNKIILPILKSNVDMWIAVSQFLKDKMVQDLKIDNSKIKVIHLAADDKFKDLNIERDIILSDTPLPELVDVYVKLLNQGLNYNLVIFSKREYGYKLFLDRVKYHIKYYPELKHKIKIVGKLSDELLLYNYNCAVIYIRIALIETFGIPVIEAMACGTPIATNRIDSLPEICGDVGFSIDNIRISEFDKQRELGLKRAKGFGWDKSVKETIDVYNEVFK